MKKGMTRSKKEIFLYVLILLLLLLVRFIDTKNYFLPKDSEYRIIPVFTQFKFTYFDESGYLTELKKEKRYHPGEKFIVEGIIEKGKASCPSIQFYSRNSTFDVFLDDSMIYSYHKESGIIGSGYHTIPLNDLKSKGNIRIVFQVSENEIPLRPDSVLFGKQSELTNLLLKTNAITFIMLGFIFVVGLFFIYLFIISDNRNHHIWVQFCFGINAICMSVWVFANSRLLQYFIHEIAIISHIEFQFFYATIITSLIFAKTSFDFLNNFKEINKYLVFSNIAVIAVLDIFNLFESISYRASLPFVHAMIFVNLMVFVLETIQLCFVQKRPLNYFAISMGFISFFIFAIFEFIFSSLLNPENIAITITYIVYGYFYLMYNIFMTAVNLIRTSHLNKTDNIKLKDLAFKDELTKLNNRTVLEEVAKALKNYTLIIFDLNNLKLLNDSFGHKTGDLILIKFSEILTLTLGEKTTLCRFGGDEFIAIIPTINQLEIESYIQSFEYTIKRTVLSSDFTISASYGISSTLEADEFDEILKLADKRMYEMKKRFHEIFGSQAKN